MRSPTPDLSTPITVEKFMVPVPAPAPSGARLRVTLALAAIAVMVVPGAIPGPVTSIPVKRPEVFDIGTTALPPTVVTVRS